MQWTRTALGAALVGVLGAALIVPHAGAAPARAATAPSRPAPAPAPTLSRVRLSLSSTSDWSVLSIPGATVAVRHLTATSGKPTITQKGDGFEVDGGSAQAPVSASFDAVVWVPSGASPTLQIVKGANGTAQATVSRIDAGGLVGVGSLDDRRAVDNTNRAVVALDRSALVGNGVSAPAADPRPLTMAFYYPWFGRDFYQDGSSHWIDTPTSAYDTTSSTAVAQQVQQAKSNGLAGFVTSFDGHHDGGFDSVLAAAGQVGGFVSAPLIELPQAKIDCGGTQCASAVERVLRDALSRAGSTSYLRSADGRPVVFMFGTWTLTPTIWATVAHDLAASGLRPFVVADDADPSWGFDGFFWYNPNGISAPEVATANRNNGWGMHLTPLVAPGTKPRVWAATVSPGEDDHLIRSPFTVQPRSNGQRYTDIWNAALSTQPSAAPDWVLVTSWNEWFENTNIAPDNVNGSTALQQTSRFASVFKSSPR